MTSFSDDQLIRCAVCGKSNPQAILASTNQMGPPDLDTRPPEMMRSTIGHWILECPECRYAAADIAATVPAPVPALVHGETYQAIDCKFQRHSWLLAQLGEFADSGWTSLHAAWVADDLGDFDTARRCRARAIELWKLAKRDGQRFMETTEGEFALAVDLLRRQGEFAEARETCIEALNEPDLTPLIEDMLRLQLTLIARADTAAHSMNEIPKRPAGAQRVTLT